MLPAVLVDDYNGQFVVAATNEGRMLVFSISELPRLARGKGNRIIAIPSARVRQRQEYVVSVAVLSPSDILMVHAGARYRKMKPNDFAAYLGDRGRRGSKLPRGFQNVDRLERVAR